MLMQYTLIYVCTARYIYLESDLSSESFGSYSWKSFFTTTSVKKSAQYRRMLEYAPSLVDALAANDTNVTWIATELEKAGLITEDQSKLLETSVDAGTRAATFLDVLKKDEATFGYILAKMKGKGMTLYVYKYFVTVSINSIPYNINVSAEGGGTRQKIVMKPSGLQGWAWI
jgi:hypothetical protein